MDMIDPNPRAAIGGNNPPSQQEIIAAQLKESYADDIARTELLLHGDGNEKKGFDGVPETIDTEAMAMRVGDFVDQITAHVKVLESHRESEKAPYLEGGRAVDGWFSTYKESLSDAKIKINVRLKTYLDKKAERERQARLEDQRKAAEVAAEAQRVADDAAATAALAAETGNQDLARTTEVAAVVAQETAQLAEATVTRATEAANAKPAELSRTRGAFGSVKSLKRIWSFKDLDKNTVNLEALRPYFAVGDIEKAVRLYVNANKPPEGQEFKQIAGVTIYPDTRL